MSTEKQSTKMNKAISLILLYSFIFTNLFAIQVYAQTDVKTVSAKSVSAKYTTDLTQLARNNSLRVNDSYENEVKQLVAALSNNSLRQPAILDEAGENQELIVEQLAIRLANGDVAKEISDKRILKLEAGSLYANAKSGANVKQIAADIFNEFANKGDVILFVDDLTNFVGKTQIGSSLSELLVSGKIRIIGGSSAVAYQRKYRTDCGS